MIWTVDPLTFCLATLILVASLLTLGDRSRAVRGALIFGALVIYLVIRVLFGESMSTATDFSPLSLLAGGLAILFAVTGLNRSAGWKLSLLTLASLAIAFVGFAPKEISWGNFDWDGLTCWAGLLHQIAILDLVACCLAATYLGVFHVPRDPHPERDRNNGAVQDDAESGEQDWSKLPSRMGTRAAVMFLVVCAALALAIYRDERLFGTSGIIAIWAAGSEALAAIVAWQAIQRWIKPGDTAKLSRWQLKLGLLVAGVAASLALLLIPVIVTAAKMVPELSG